MTRQLLSAFLVLMLSACAASNIGSDYKLAAGKSAGVATGSITYNDSYGAYRLVIESMQTGETYRIEHGASQTLNPFMLGRNADTHAGLKKKGSPFAVELPAGRYVLAQWRIAQGTWSFASTVPTGVVFEVLPGQAIYLGNFDFHGGGQFFRRPKPAYVSLIDESARDLPVLKSEFRALDAAPIAQGLEPGTRINELAGIGGVDLTIPVYVPVAKR